MQTKTELLTQISTTLSDATLDRMEQQISSQALGNMTFVNNFGSPQSILNPLVSMPQNIFNNPIPTPNLQNILANYQASLRQAAPSFPNSQAEITKILQAKMGGSMKKDEIEDKNRKRARSGEISSSSGISASGVQTSNNQSPEGPVKKPKIEKADENEDEDVDIESDGKEKNTTWRPW